MSITNLDTCRYCGMTLFGKPIEERTFDELYAIESLLWRTLTHRIYGHWHDRIAYEIQEKFIEDEKRFGGKPDNPQWN